MKITALWYGLLAALANIVGGLWISGHNKLSPRLLKYLIAIGAGFMLAAVFLEIIPASLAAADCKPGQVMLLVLLGYLVIQFCEHTVVSHFHFGEETHSHMLSRHAAMTAVGGLTIHTFFDGVSIASGFAIDFKLGLLIFVAILLHKLPEGFTVASIMIAAGRSRGEARAASILVGFATLLGAIVIIVLARVVTFALPFSAGVTLYVAASDLIPEVNTGEERKTISIAVFGGVALYYGTVSLLDYLHIA